MIANRLVSLFMGLCIGATESSLDSYTRPGLTLSSEQLLHQADGAGQVTRALGPDFLRKKLKQAL